MDRFFALPINSSLRWCPRLSTGTPGTVDFMWVSPGYLVTALLQSCPVWRSNVCFRRALHVSSALLAQMSSTGFLQMPTSFHTESTREEWGVRLLIFEGFQNHSFCILWIRDSVIQPGQLVSSNIFWSAGTSTSPKGSPSVCIDHPEPTFNLYTSSAEDAASLQIRARYMREW